MNSPKDRLNALVARIRATRVNYGWTQEELARRAGVTTRAIQQLEQNSSITLKRLFKISMAFGIDEEFDGLFCPKEQSIEMVKNVVLKRKARARPHSKCN